MLEVHGVSKLYAPDKGLTSAEFHAVDGDILALLGPNGSGKSTLMKILCDVHTQDRGECILDGVPTTQCKAHIGYLPEVPYSAPSLTGMQFLRYIAGMKGENSLDYSIDMLAFFEADTYAHERIGSLSLGQQKRFALIAALMGNPRLLILDEPTNGFDTMTLLKMKELLRIRSAQGKITILSSHVLDFVQSLASKVVFIKNGITLPEDDNIARLEETYINLFMS